MQWILLESVETADHATRMVIVRAPPHRVATTKNDQLEQF